MLPPLSQLEAQHSAAVAGLIGAEIAAAGGWITFERFMELALYAPGLGYYSAGSHKLGAGGDFVTAPEVSGLFGRCVARACAGVLEATGGDILELGAGTGRLAAQLLTALAGSGTLPRRYAILEVSADLAARQQAALALLPPPLRERVEWLSELPRDFRGVMLANEVADALPCRRFAVRGSGLVRELGVALEAQGAFRETDGEPSAELAREWQELAGSLGAALPAGYVSEVCPRASAWIASLADSLAQGAVLVFDYGLPRRHYYHPQRLTGTLRCHFRQRVHDDPYINVGVQDITAWVDFTRLAEAALAAQLEVTGFTTQAAFLLESGIEAQVAQAPEARERARLAGEARRLMMPEEMGEAFKVLAMGRGTSVVPGGFTLQDLRHLL